MESNSTAGESRPPIEFPYRPPPPERKGGGYLWALVAALLVAGALLLALGVPALLFAGAFIQRFNEAFAGRTLAGGNTLQEVYHSGSRFATNKIALIRVKGIILNGVNDWNQGADAEFVCDQLAQAAEDDSVKAILLHIDSPGGEVTASDNIHHRVSAARAAGKPVVAFMDSLAASGGYYVAAAADSIVAHRLTLTGSIGVRIDSIKYYDLMGKIGLSEEVYKSKEMKDMLSGSRPTSPSEREIVQSLVDECYDRFVEVVSEGRRPKNPQLTPEHIKSTIVGDGRVLSGAQALELGLVDALGYYEDAEDEAAALANLDGDYKVVTYKKHVSLMDILGALEAEASVASRAPSAVRLELPGAARRSLLEPGKMYMLPDFWFE